MGMNAWEPESSRRRNGERPTGEKYHKAAGGSGEPQGRRGDEHSGKDDTSNRMTRRGRRLAGKGRAEYGHDRRTSRTTVECVEQFRRNDHGVVWGLRTRPFTTQPLEPAVLERELEIHVCVVFIRIQIYIRRN